MKWDIETRLSAIRIAYVAASLFLLTLVALTPLLVNREVPLTKSFVVKEDLFEAMAITLLMGMAWASSRLYQARLRRISSKMRASELLCSRLEKRLADAFGYIGTVNVQIGQIESILGRIERYPQSRKQFQQVLDALTRKAMAIAAAEWAVVRIVHVRNLRTLKEAHQRRAGARGSIGSISNRSLIEGHIIDGRITVSTRAQNLAIRTVLVLPLKPLQDQKRILLSAIASEIEMRFLLFESDAAADFR